MSCFPPFRKVRKKKGTPSFILGKKKKNPPATAGANGTNSLTQSSLIRHPTTGLAFMRIDRNQKRITVGVGEFVSLDIRAVLERAVHIEAIIILRPEIFDVLQHNAFTIGALLPLQLHGGLLPSTQRGSDDVPSSIDLNWSFLHFQFFPFQTVGLENHRR